MRRPSILLALFLLAIVAGSPSFATELTFDQQTSIPTPVPVDQDYGDRVLATDVGELRYRASGGFTRHVVVEYGETLGDSEITPEITPSMSDRFNVLRRADVASTELIVTLTADPGWSVVLDGFDLPAVSTTGLPGDLVVLSSLAVVDGSGNVLFQETLLSLETDFAERIAFDPPLEGEQLRVVLFYGGTASVASVPSVTVRPRGRELRPGLARDGRRATRKSATLDLARVDPPAGIGLGTFADIGVDNLRFRERGPVPYNRRLDVRGGIAGPIGVTLVDLDGDGVLDVLTAQGGDDDQLEALVVQSPEGDEQFGPARTIAIGGGALAPESADVDGDGDADVVVGWTFGAKVVWYENLGDGVFGDEQTIVAGESIPTALTTGDLDGDGALDVIVGTFESAVVAYFGDGGASWDPDTITIEEGVEGDPGAIPLGIATLDGDHDGDLDVLVAFDVSPHVAYYRNIEADGWSFGWSLFPGDGARRQVIAADIDRDGFDDAVVAACEFGDPDLQRIDWYRKVDPDGDDASEDFDIPREIASGIPCPETLAAADLDADGDVDVLSGSPFGDLLIHRNLGDQRFVSSSPPGGQSAATDGVAVGDVDRDGDPDIVAASTGEGRLVYLPNESIHRSSIFPDGEAIQSAFDVSELLALDLDRDGDVDLAAGSAALGRLDRIENDGEGGFQDVEGAISFDVSGLAAIAAGELGAGPHPDIVVAADTLRALVNGSFGFFDEFITDDDVVATAVATGDIEVGRRDDEIVAGLSTEDDVHELRWFRDATGGEGEDFWSSRFVAESDKPIAAVDAVDLDGDGKTDILAAVSDLVELPGTSVVFFEQFDLEGPEFPERRSVASVDDVRALAHADLDGDGDPDVLIAADGAVLWSENRLDLDVETVFVEHEIDQLGADSILAADVDADGDLDVLTLSEVDDALRWYENLDGTGLRWTVRSPRPFVVSPLASALADGDGDGDLDLFLAEVGLLSWFPNRGGQYAFESEDETPAMLFEGEPSLLLSVAITPNGISDDSASRVEALGLDFDDPLAEFDLDPAALDSWIDRLEIYVDLDGSGFDPANTEPIAVVERLDVEPGGLLSIPLDSTFATVTKRTLFHIAAVTTADGAGAQFIARFAPERTVLRDAKADVPLTQQAGEALPVFASALDTLRVDSFADAPDESDADLACSTATLECTLRAAIQEANARPGDDLVVLDAGLYAFTVPGLDDGPGGAGAGDLDITDAVTIRGQGIGATIVDAGLLDRVFDVHGTSGVVLEGMTIRGGLVAADGGAIRLGGSQVSIVECEIISNLAFGAGGAIALDAASALDLQRSTVAMNTAVGDGGAVDAAGDLAIVRSTLARNSAGGDGTIAVQGTMTADGLTVSGNEVGGVGGAIAVGVAADVTLRSSTLFDNRSAAGGAGLDITGTAAAANTILAGNGPGADCVGALDSGGYNLIEDASGCTIAGDAATVLTAVDPGLGPLQGNPGHPTDTHDLATTSPAVDAGLCPDGEPGDRGLARTDLPDVPNAVGGDGCDIGVVELPIGVALPSLDVPVRWCLVEGAPSFDPDAGTFQADVNEGLRARHDAVNRGVYRRSTGVKFVSGANVLIPDYPILQDRRCAAGCEEVGPGERGSVVVEPKARDYEEFLDLVAACRAEWQLRDPTIVGITAVSINRFVDPQGEPIGLLGIGGRAKPGDAVMQSALGAVMVVDRSLLEAEGQPAEIDRVLAHELGHAAGALQHGDGRDNALDGGKETDEQCANGVLDDDDDRCVPQPRFDGDNLMQYRAGSGLTDEQILQLREHLSATIPELNGELLSSTLTDAGSLEDEKARIFDLEKARIFDLEKARIFDLEKARIFDLEKARIFDLEESEILDAEFANIYEFGMNIDENETQLYASYGGLPWPSPVRPDTLFLWYLDLDQNDLTGGLPEDEGFPPTQQPEDGVDIIGQVFFFSECDADKVCSDSALLTIFSWDDENPLNGFVPVVEDEPIDSIEGLDLGLVQTTGGQEPEREQPASGMLIRLPIDNALLTNALPEPGYVLGADVDIEVLAALPCKTTLPSGDELDCQCLSCGVCPEYPGCAETGQPIALGICAADGAPCRQDAECQTTGDVCKFGRIVPESPGGTLTFETPLFPGCEVVSGSTAPGEEVTIVVEEFPTDTGQGFTVVLDGATIGTEPDPVFVDERSTLTATLPDELLVGTLELTVILDGFATTADCEVVVALDDGRRFFSTVGDQFAPGIGTMRQQHAYVLDLDDGSFELAVPAFLTPFVGLDALDVKRDGSALFSTRTNGGVTHAGGFSSLKQDRVYRRDEGGVITPAFDWGGIEVGTLNAIAGLDDGTYVFSTESLRAVTHAGGFLVLRPQNAYRIDPASGVISLVLDGQALGLRDLDGIDYPDGRLGGRVVFSTATDQAILVGGGLVPLKQRSAYELDPLTGSVSVAIDGVGAGLASLDAVDTGGD